MEPSVPAGGPHLQAAVPLAQFLQCLVDSGLLPAEEVRALTDKVTPKQAGDARWLAQELVRLGKLTRYQAQMLYQGKVKGLVLGNYTVLDKLGEGGMGMVFKARQRTLDRLVALKVLPTAVCQTPVAVKRFRREVEAAGKLSHPNIVHASDADEFQGIHFLVMEYVEGSDLSRLVKAQGPLSLDLAVSCLLQAAHGLAHAHRAGVIHRDIKPSNLLLDSRGVLKILDMGLARIDSGNDPDREGSSELTKSGSILGTCDYMAPEQALNTKKADHRSDIYSLGCTLHYLLIGRAVYGGETQMEKLLAHREAAIPSLRGLRADVPPALDALFARMIAKKPQDRPQSMAEVTTALELWRVPRAVRVPCPVPPSTTDTRIDCEPATDVHSPANRLGRQMLRWGVVGGAVATALGVAAVWIGGSSRSVPAPATQPIEAVAAPPVTSISLKPPSEEDLWRQKVEHLPAQQQVEEVTARLKARNPNFTGPVTPTINGNVVVGLSLPARHIIDLSPVRALAGLQTLQCNAAYGARSKLSDLAPLRGLKLTALGVSFTDVADLAPLTDMPLAKLWIRETRVRDLAPLRKLPLTLLFCPDTPITDLGPLRDCRTLTELEFWSTPVRDLRPLRGLPLRSVICALGPGVTLDVSPLVDCPVEELRYYFPPEQLPEMLRTHRSLKMLNNQSVLELRRAMEEARAVEKWRVLGPFALNEKEPFDPAANGGALADDVLARTYTGLAGQRLVWREQAAGAMGVLDLKPVDDASAFGYATVDSETERDVDLYLGSDDYLTLWLNGRKLYEYRKMRSWSIANDRVRARLKKGANYFLVRCDNIRGPWVFSVRITNEAAKLSRWWEGERLLVAGNSP